MDVDWSAADGDDSGRSRAGGNHPGGGHDLSRGWNCGHGNCTHQLVCVYHEQRRFHSKWKYVRGYCGRRSAQRTSHFECRCNAYRDLLYGCFSSGRWQCEPRVLGRTGEHDGGEGKCNRKHRTADLRGDADSQQELCGYRNRSGSVGPFSGLLALCAQVWRYDDRAACVASRSSVRDAGGRQELCG